MNMLSNVKIGRKLALVFGVGILQVLCMAGMITWIMSSLQSGSDSLQKEARAKLLAQKVLSDASGVTVAIANATINKRASAEDQAMITALRKDYATAFDEVKMAATEPEGKKMVSDIETSTANWREVNNLILAALADKKDAEAAKLFRERDVPNFNSVQAVIAEYLNYLDKRNADTAAQIAASTSRMTTVTVLFCLVVLGASIVFGIFLTRSITKPLEAAVTHLERVAQGDISRDMDKEYLERKDEVGSFAVALETMSTSLRQVIGEIVGGMHILASSSSELSASSGRMSAGSKQASSKAHTVAAAAEEMSSNVVSVAAGMEQASTNLKNVSIATEQMTATIGEIAGNSEKARRITTEANRQANHITEQMNQLGQAAREIGKVTETIMEISSQTNLLALNATIEAARAGSAGKGFAVVANEIKELAQQTAAATEDIKARVAGVQSSTAAGVSEIEKISGVIHEVSDIVSSIAAAIEEQAAATKDIARNIGEASNGVEDANTRVAQSSSASQEIAREIVGVDQAAGEMAEGSENVRASATDLSKVAEQLSSAVGRFKV
jgi:methyl-accepting chemotaxis protein